MKCFIATTTINPPTEAVRLFDETPGWQLIVAVDKKTPADYKLKRGIVLSTADQEAMDPELSQAIGWNTIQRRNFAILAAYKAGADVLAIVDDDNIPLPGWGENLLLGRPVKVNCYQTTQPVFDPVGLTNHGHLWHRGFPLELISSREYGTKTIEEVVPDVQADFWNGDPDIDAICRMEHRPDCSFDDSYFPIASNRPSPFNSQNTFILRKVIPDYFLAPDIGRQDDIWASYYAQAKGHRVVYGKASVVQKRNEHDLMKDFEAEIIGYRTNLKLVRHLMEDPATYLDFLPERAKTALALYQRHFR